MFYGLEYFPFDVGTLLEWLGERVLPTSLEIRPHLPLERVLRSSYGRLNGPLTFLTIVIDK